ncbi:hypothetical protein F5146DRAFT_1003292 [Armillaria mellea]|nr:hypothetical protein F5146DRAFT_1003292 [Armillaria mellea]
MNERKSISTREENQLGITSSQSSRLFGTRLQTFENESTVPEMLPFVTDAALDVTVLIASSSRGKILEDTSGVRRRKKRTVNVLANLDYESLSSSANPKVSPNVRSTPKKGHSCGHVNYCRQSVDGETWMATLKDSTDSTQAAMAEHIGSEQLGHLDFGPEARPFWSWLETWFSTTRATGEFLLRCTIFPRLGSEVKMFALYYFADMLGYNGHMWRRM